MSWKRIRLVGFFKLMVSYCIIADSTIESSAQQRFFDYILSNHSLGCQVDILCSSNKTQTWPEYCRSCVKCQCDAQCKLYGDCCPDLLFTKTTPKQMDRKLKYYCQSYAFKLAQPTEQPAHFFSVARCSSFTDPFLVSLCHTPNSTDPHMRIPVTSASGEIYRNEFCAMCNEETKYKLWNFKLACTVPLSVPSTMLSKDIVKYFLHHPHCSVSFSPPNSTHVRSCYADSAMLIRTCNETGVWKNYDALMEKACTKYYSPVIDNSRSFKNIFCFYCNTGNQDKPNRSCEVKNSEQFSVLLNPDRIHKPQRQAENGCECQQNEVCHKFKKECRPLLCSFGRTLEEKRCVSSYTSAENAPYSLEMTLTPSEDIYTAPDTVTLITTIASGVTASFKDKTKQFHIRIHMMRLRSVMNVNETRVLRIILKLNLILVSEHQVDEFESLLIDMQNSKWRIPFQGTFLNMTSEFSNIFNDSKLDTDFTNETILVTSNETDYHYLTYMERTEHMNNNKITITPINYTAVSKTLFCPLVELNRNEIRSQTELGKTFVLVVTNLTVISSEILITAEGMILVCQDVIQGTVCYSEGIFSDDFKLVSRISLGLSLICLFATLVVYSLFPSLRTLPGKNIMGLISTLFIAIALNLFGSRQVETVTLCKIIGGLFHFFLLSTFTWTGICTFHMYRVFTSVLQSRSSISSMKNIFAIYLCISIMVPLVIMFAVFGISYAVHGMPHVGYGSGGCIVSNIYFIILGLILPVSVILLFNFILFVLTVVSLRKMSANHRKLTGKKDNVHMYVKLSSLTGVNWLFAFLAPLTGVQILWYVFVVLCGLQGVYIFLAFVCNKRVFKLLKNMFKGNGLRISNTAGANIQTSILQRNTTNSSIEIKNGNGVLEQDAHHDRSTKF